MADGIVARAHSARGELVVRRRDDDVLELRVNGVFAMDTAETSTERLLAERALAHVDGPRRVLVGGLGLGYTVRALLADPRVEHVLVIEIESTLVAWMRDGVLPGADLLADPRLEVLTQDVRRLVGTAAKPPDTSAADPGTAPPFDVILLDVDNGPDFLVYDDNAAVYEQPFLTRCRAVLSPTGALSVWSSTYSPALHTRLQHVFGHCHAEPIPVDLQGRDEQYWLFTSTISTSKMRE